MKKQEIFHVYGEPTLCKPAEGQGGIKETCIYRKPAGGLILLDFGTLDNLDSWQIQD